MTAASPVSNAGIFGATAVEGRGAASVDAVTPRVVVVLLMVVVGEIFGRVALGEAEVTVGIAICPTGARVVFT